MAQNKCLATVQNNDINNILCDSSGKDVTPEEYREAVGHLLDGKPSVLAQNVGMPDPVIYRSQVATAWDKHIVEVSVPTWPKEDPAKVRARTQPQADAMTRLVSAGTDPLQLTIEVCRARGVLVVASYRMNGEDWYFNSWKLSDFGRAHPDWRIPDSGVLDPAIPGVYEHRMNIFKEVAEEYDVDGIEFDFRRWLKMISDPLKNHPILTRMVRETRHMLDETARSKGKNRLVLGARVGPSLADPLGTEYPGGNAQIDLSCWDLGLDVETWIEEELVDYVCPALFNPRLPGVPETAEFAALARDRDVGIYPTVFPVPAWADEEVSIADTSADEIKKMMQKHRDEICRAALQCYADGADGISTFNWWGHSLFSATLRSDRLRTDKYRSSEPYHRTELFVHRFLRSPEALRQCLEAQPVVSARGCEWSA